MVGLSLSLYPDAGEAGGCFYRPPSGRKPSGGDPDRAKAEAARRARSKVRRYCAANRLNRLGTLTYAGDGCHDVNGHLEVPAGGQRKSPPRVELGRVGPPGFGSGAGFFHAEAVAVGRDDDGVVQ